MASTCVVACKFPPGLNLRVGHMVERQINVLGGGVKIVKEWFSNGDVVKINGPKRTLPDDPTSPLADGFALTFGVDLDFMQQWLKDNAETPLVKGGFIKIHTKATELKAMTREMAGVATGLEPLAIDGDKRVPRNVAPRSDRAA